MFPLTAINLTSLGVLSGHLQKLIEQKLWLQVLIGLALGLVAGVLIGPDLALISADNSLLISSWLALPGQLFLALIQMIVVPLVLASVMRGLTAASSISQLKKMGLLGGGFFFVTTVLASTIVSFLRRRSIPAVLSMRSWLNSRLIWARWLLSTPQRPACPHSGSCRPALSAYCRTIRWRRSLPAIC